MDCAEKKTAKIYTFPLQPRASGRASHLARLEAEARRYANTDFGSGWYHDDAIQSSDMRRQ